ncbi:MAG: phenylalanine--tRNA ligase subunit alpha [Candidatus Aenigmatarchaeota archaeon]
MAEYKLTEEGEGYLKNGLPEKNLIKFLDSLPQKTATIGKTFSQVKNYPIALKWAMEKNWVLKQADKLTLLKPPHETEEEIALKKISEGKKVDEKILNVLIQRNLVMKVSETFVITERELAKSGNVIDKLTHEMIVTGLWKDKKFKQIDVEVVRKKLKKSTPGKRQPYNQFLMYVREKLVKLGFKEMVGPTIEMEFWNFDALFQPQNHPARDWTQTYSLKSPKELGRLPSKQIVERVKATHEDGWKTGSTGWKYKWNPEIASRLMPRAHDTAITPRYMAKGLEIPGRYFDMVRCYRPDVIDATHGVEFIQTGGIVVGKDLTFKHLLGLLKQFAVEIAGIKKVKFFTDYYPFTEPSVQISGLHPKLGWIELAGAGIFRPELTEPLGVKEPVLAWGFGIDRLAMNALKINDIRELFTRNLEWLRNQKVEKYAKA